MTSTPRRLHWLLIPGALSLALLVGAGSLAAQLVFLSAGNSAWQGGDNPGAEQQYSRSMAASVLNAWIPVHNRGVARFGQSSWDAAAADFEESALFAPAGRQCTVRLNWSLALESGADALRDAGDVPGALVRYTQAEVVLAATSCDDSPAAAGGTLSDAWKQARQRVESKKTDGNSTFTPPEESLNPSDATDELDERGKQAQEERQRAEEQHMGETPVEGGSGERNW